MQDVFYYGFTRNALLCFIGVQFIPLKDGLNPAGRNDHIISWIKYCNQETRFAHRGVPP